MKLSVMFVVLCSRTQQLMIALGEYNSWFGSFPCFYHHRVRLHNSLISSCGSSFALHSTRALRRYMLSIFFKKKNKKKPLQIFLFLYDPCPANLPDIWWQSTENSQVVWQTTANFISIQHGSISPQQPQGEPDVYHSHGGICSDSHVRSEKNVWREEKRQDEKKRRDRTKTFKRTLHCVCFWVVFDTGYSR